MITSAHSKSSHSSAINPILQKFYKMICEIIVSKILCGIFLIFCRLVFINNFMVKNSFSEKNSAKVKCLETHLFFKTYSAMFCRFYLYKPAGRIEKIFFNHQISAKKKLSNFSKKNCFYVYICKL